MKWNKSEIIVTQFLFIKSIKGFNQESGCDTKLWENNSKNFPFVFLSLPIINENLLVLIR